MKFKLKYVRVSKLKYQSVNVSIELPVRSIYSECLNLISEFKVKLLVTIKLES